MDTIARHDLCWRKRKLERVALKVAASIGNSTNRNDNNERVETKYGLYRIVAGFRGSEYQAIAYAGARQSLVAAAMSVAEAVAQLQRDIDARTEQRLLSRNDGIPVAEEFLDAFEALHKSFSEPRIRLMKLHCRRPDHTAHFADIARLIGITATAAESEYARLGNRVSSLLRFYPAPKWTNRSFAGILVLATPVGARDIRSPFQLRPQVVAALEAFFNTGSLARS